MVISPGDEAAYRAAAGAHAGRLTFIEQPQPLGYGHAIHCAAEFCGSDPFLLLVGDHLYLSATREGLRAAARRDRARGELRRLRRAVDAREQAAVLRRRRRPARDAAQRLYQVETVLEKPTPTEAEQKLDVPGLRAGYYLCFFGMHVLTPAVQRILGELFAASQGGEASVQLPRRARAAGAAASVISPANSRAAATTSA